MPKTSIFIMTGADFQENQFVCLLQNYHLITVSLRCHYQISDINLVLFYRNIEFSLAFPFSSLFDFLLKTLVIRFLELLHRNVCEDLNLKHNFILERFLFELLYSFVRFESKMKYLFKLENLYLRRKKVMNSLIIPFEIFRFQRI